MFWDDILVGPAMARLEGVNKPELLPQGGPVTPLIDVAGFLTEGEENRIRMRLSALEEDTGIKVRVLAQTYPDTPGLAIKDYWGVDDNTVVFVYVLHMPFCLFLHMCMLIMVLANPRAELILRQEIFSISMLVKMWI